MNGHWFCSGPCNDIVNMRAPVGRWDSLRDVTCPVCHHQTAFWVKHIPTLTKVTPERARQLFAEMRANFEPGDSI